MTDREPPCNMTRPDLEAEVSRLRKRLPANDGIRIGDTIKYRPCFGMHPATRAKVTEITVTERPRDKHGREVDEVSLETIKANRALFSLDDGHWCYSEQVQL